MFIFVKMHISKNIKFVENKKNVKNLNLIVLHAVFLNKFNIIIIKIDKLQ